jgi:predicted dehydrogenase
MRTRIAVVGLNHGYALARSALLCGSVELVGLCARNPHNHQEQAERLGVPLFGSLDSMLVELDLDGVAIAAPTEHLVSMAKSCLERNICVLVEKPLGIGVSQVKELRDTAARSTAHVVVGYYRRLGRQVVALKSLLASGVIGDVLGVSCKWIIKKPPGYFQGWKSSRARGGGLLMINTIHDLDMLQHLLGPIETVAAMESRSDRAEDDLEHLLVVNMKFRGGQIGTAFFSDQSPSPYSYDNTVAAVTKFPQYPVDSHHFFGTMGSLAFPSFTVYSSRSPGGSWYDLMSASTVSDANTTVDDPIAGEIEHFARVVRGNALPHATIDDAIQNLAVVSAIRRALELSTEVTV